MKASWLLPVLVFGLPGLSPAASGFTVGGGLNSSFINEDEEGESYSNYTGFNFGIGYEAEIAPAFSLAPEVNLETRGESVRADGIDAHLKMLYLQIPLFAMIKVPVGRVGLDFFAGPELGIPLSAKATLDYEGNSYSGDVKDQINSPDFGVELGAGAEFPVGRGAFFIRPSYYAAFTNMFDEDDSASDTKLRNIKVKLGFRFPV